MREKIVTVLPFRPVAGNVRCQTSVVTLAPNASVALEHGRTR
jgi:hypothetical protein